MTLCPVAIVASCKKCPVFKLCPGKGIIGDHRKTPAATAPSKTGPAG